MSIILQNAAEIKVLLPENKKFTLVGGCFDLIHVGHVHFLEFAASLEECLVVAVRSDKYIQALKGPQRPIIGQDHRAKMVSSIRCVDYVYISDVSPSSAETLKQLRPDTILFGWDSSNMLQIRKRIENIRFNLPDTKIEFLPRTSRNSISTSYIVNRIGDLK